MTPMALINKEDTIKSLRFSCGLNEDGILYVPLKDVIKSIENMPVVDEKKCCPTCGSPLFRWCEYE